METIIIAGYFVVGVLAGVLISVIAMSFGPAKPKPAERNVQIAIVLNSKDYDSPMDTDAERIISKRIASRLGYEIIRKFPGCRKRWKKNGKEFYGVSFIVRDNLE